MELFLANPAKALNLPRFDLPRVTNLALMVPEVFGITQSVCRGEQLALPWLRSVGGLLDMNGCENLSFPNLKRIGSSLHIEQCRHLAFPALEEMGWSLYGKGAEDVSFARLGRVGGNVSVRSGKDVTFPALEHIVAGLSLGLSTGCTFDWLKSVGLDVFANNSRNIELPALVSAGGLYVGESENLSFPCLETVARNLHKSEEAVALSIPKLRSVNGAPFTPPATRPVGDNPFGQVGG